MVRVMSTFVCAILVLASTAVGVELILYEDFSGYSDTSFIGPDPANPGPTGWFYNGPSEGTDSIETLPTTVLPAQLGVAPDGTSTAYLVIFGNSPSLKDTNLGWISSTAVYETDAVYSFSFWIAAAAGELEDVGVYWQSPPLGGNQYTTPGLHDWEMFPMDAQLDTYVNPEYVGVPVQIQINIDGNQTGGEFGDQCYITGVNVRMTPYMASDPSPRDTEISVRPSVRLSWQGGIYAPWHEVYFGDDPDRVFNATRQDEEYKGNYPTTSWDPPGCLDYCSTYFWRIDANNGEPGVWKGPVWSFTTNCGDPNLYTCWDPAECAGQPFGEGTCDGNTNFADLAQLKMSFFSIKGDGRYDCCADYDHDEQINFADLAILKAYMWGGPYSPSTGEQCCPP